jgi:1,4-alpha-glucan branching enzyme
VVSNFTPVQYENFVIGLPRPGTLHEILNSDEERFGGSGVRNKPLVHARREGFLDMDYSARITLPPMSTVFFRYRPRKEHKKK